jgi:ribosomal protein S27AE
VSSAPILYSNPKSSVNGPGVYINLLCPTCGGGLQVAAEKNQFACHHCGNKYLLDRKLEELDAAERQHIQPSVTYTEHIQQWLRVAEYEVCLQRVSLETVDKERVLYIDVAYRNPSSTALTCRHEQWLVFDTEGYTYEPVKDFDARELYEGNTKRYLGMSRIITPGMRLRGWLAFLVPAPTTIEYLQFSGGAPTRTVEYKLQLGQR